MHGLATIDAAEAQIPKLCKLIASMQTVRAHLMPELTRDQSSGGGPVSKTKLHRDQNDAEPDRRGGKGARAPQIEQKYSSGGRTQQIKQEDSEHESHV